MRYGFIIDNRKCIGCHACTTACKSEHQVPVGVNRTWVKQVEKGIFPDTRRIFSVMRCNHCTDAPCVDICPVEALFKRDDGIVDFDKNRCIGCKSCMQACPYDALYIDPDTHTAAKCNYCAHRIDIGLEPACVNVCPEHAIISGDMENPETEISQLLSQQQVTVRKAEKGTQPNLFYIDGDEASLNPTATEKSESYFWSSQSTGVGHYAKQAEKLMNTNVDLLAELSKVEEPNPSSEPHKSIDVLLGKARRTYDAPDKGILWGWEVSAYVFTKAIATGAFLIPFLAWAFGWAEVGDRTFWTGLGLGLLFLSLTGILLVKDLDRPDRFLNVLFRPQWKSWLVKGGYAITLFGGLLTLLAVASLLHWQLIKNVTMWFTAFIAVIVAVYTAFLFAQAKGRDFWQSPTLSIHMLVHSLMAGAALFLILVYFLSAEESWVRFLEIILMVCIGINLSTILVEMITTHPTEESRLTAQSIVKGAYKNRFWGGIILFGNMLPFIILLSGNIFLTGFAGLMVLIGIYITEHVWVEAPQKLPLS